MARHAVPLAVRRAPAAGIATRSSRGRAVLHDGVRRMHLIASRGRGAAERSGSRRLRADRSAPLREDVALRWPRAGRRRPGPKRSTYIVVERLPARRRSCVRRPRARSRDDRGRRASPRRRARPCRARPIVSVSVSTVPVAVGLELEAQHVLAPDELQQARRVAGDHRAVEAGTFAVAELEAQRRAVGAFTDDLGREPRRELLGLGQRAPDLLGRMRAARA